MSFFDPEWPFGSVFQHSVRAIIEVKAKEAMERVVDGLDPLKVCARELFRHVTPKSNVAAQSTRVATSVVVGDDSNHAPLRLR